jgi:hypothetical protein
VVVLFLVISCLKQKAKLPSNSLPHVLSLYLEHTTNIRLHMPAFLTLPGYQLVKEHKNEREVLGRTRYSGGSNEFSIPSYSSTVSGTDLSSILMQKQGQICRMLWKKACANRSKFNVVNE